MTANIVATAPPAPAVTVPQSWDDAIKGFVAADKINPPPQGGIVFIGSSTIRLWKTLSQDFPGYTVINRGFGGSVIADSVRYADKIVIPYKPRLIVFFAGTNDIDQGKSARQVANDFGAFVRKVHASLPQARIAFMAITPTPRRIKELATVRHANDLIREYISMVPYLDYIDTFTPFLDAHGQPRADLFGPDKLHNSPAGYKLRADIVRPHLAGFESRTASKDVSRSVTSGELVIQPDLKPSAR